VAGRRAVAAEEARLRGEAEALIDFVGCRIVARMRRSLPYGEHAWSSWRWR